MPSDYRFELTLNTDKHLEIEDVVATLRNVEAMLEDIERTIRQRPNPEAKWGWTEDPGLHFVASVNGVDEATLKQIVTTAHEGLQQAAAARRQVAPEWPPGFGQRARTSAESILSLLDTLDSITVEATGKGAVELGELENLGSVKRLYSSVDGILETLGRHSENRIYAGIREFRTGHHVRCYLDRMRWRQHISDRGLWEKHVTVYGRVTYDVDGVPILITDVSAIDERSGRRKLSELEGELSGLTGRQSTHGFIRRLRGYDA